MMTNKRTKAPAEEQIMTSRFLSRVDPPVNLSDVSERKIIIKKRQKSVSQPVNPRCAVPGVSQRGTEDKKSTSKC